MKDKRMFMTVREVAKKIGCTTKDVRELVLERKLTPSSEVGSMRFTREYIEYYIYRHFEKGDVRTFFKGEIFFMWADGEKIIDIIFRTGIPRSLIKRICKEEKFDDIENLPGVQSLG